MFEKMSSPCRATFRAAHRIAAARACDQLDTDCIMLGLTQVGNDTIPARVLESFGIWDVLCKMTNKILQAPKVSGVSYLQSEEARKTIEEAHDISIQTGHHFIGTEHIFGSLVGRSPLLTKVCKEYSIEEDSLRRKAYISMGIDANTPEDYRRHGEVITKILEDHDDARLAMRAIARYMRENIPFDMSSIDQT
jgi:ATP-dependent Clp protease ATP-binding subunit ClpA